MAREKIDRRLNYVGLSTAQQVLANLPELNSRLTLVGAYALMLNLENFGVRQHYARETSDLDFDFCGSLGILNCQRFQMAMSERLQGTQFRFVFLNEKIRESTLTWVFQVWSGNARSTKLKIDFKITPAPASFSVAPIEYMLAHKVALATKIVDRRPKDKSDVCAMLYLIFNRRMTKGDFLRYIHLYGESLADRNPYDNPADLAKIKLSFQGFKPEVPLPNLPNGDVISVLCRFYNGLYSNAVPLNYVFDCKGGWLNVG